MSATSSHGESARRYVEACRARIPRFVRRHFSLTGSLALHRAALGGDLWRAPVNTLLAVPAFLVRLSACLARGVRLVRLAERLERLPLGVVTAVDRRVEALIVSELLALPIAARGSLRAHAPLSRLLRRYVRTRSAMSELGVNALMLCVGAIAFEHLTPGSLSAGTAMAQALAERSALESFPLGTWAGEAYYAMFPVSWSFSDVAVAFVAIIGAVALLSTFVGILADPLQAALGIHRRRLERLVDAIERLLVRGDDDFKPKDAYFARLVDLADAARAAGTLFP